MTDWDAGFEQAHEWIIRTKAANVDLEAWAATIA